MRVKITMPSLRWPVGTIVDVIENDAKALVDHGFAVPYVEAPIDDEHSPPVKVSKQRVLPTATKGADE
jgi:hypothetical protein